MKASVLIVLILFLSCAVHAQNHKLFTSQTANDYLLFPTQTFKEEGIGVLCDTKITSISGISINASLLASHFSVLNHKAKISFAYHHSSGNLINQHFGNANFSYRVNLGNGKLSSALGYGLLTSKVQPLNILDLDDANIPMMNYNASYCSTLHLSLAYELKNLNLAFTRVHQLDEPEINYDMNQNAYYFLTQYLFKINEKHSLNPMLLIRNINHDDFVHDYNLIYQHQYIGKIAFGYRTNQSLLTCMEFNGNKFIKQWPKELSFAYAFDYSISSRNSYLSNEIVLKYVFKNNAYSNKIMPNSPYKSPVFF
jgi:hypothetical protein